ncbi:unnamed protein product [Closterium sp. NIES-53]
MASLSVLTFDHEGRPIQFDTWLDDLQLYLLSDSRDIVSLFDHTSGASFAPPAPADSATRSQWLTRDDAARLAVRNHMPLAERAHFEQHKTAKALYDAVVARYSSPATAALGRLLLPYLFLELSAFATVEDLVTTFALATLATALPFHQSSLTGTRPRSLLVDLLEQHLLAAETSVVTVGATRGTPRTPFFEGCSPSPLAPSYASNAAVDILSAADVGAASTVSGKRHNSKSKGGGGGGDGSGGGIGGGGGGSGGGGSGGSGGGSGGSGGGSGGGGGGGGSGNNGSGGSRGGAAQRGGSSGGQRQQQQQRRSETPSPQQLRPVAPSCSCRLLLHQTLLWHHRLGHPSLPRFCGMHSRLLVSSLPRSLPPLPPSPAPPCLPYVEGRQRAAPHPSSFPPTSAPLQTLHMDVWGPARVSGQGRERYFLLVVDALHHSLPLVQQGTFLSSVCTLTEVQNGIAERRIGLVMEVARTSMIHTAAPHFLWSFAVRYAAHQLNLWPRVSLPETSPTLRWTGKVGDASVVRVWGSRAFVCNMSADKLSSRAIPCDVTFDESVPFYRPAPSGVSHVDPIPRTVPVKVAVDSGAARGTVSRRAASWGAEPASAEPRGSESEGAEPVGAEYEGADSGGAEPRDTASSRGPAAAGAGGSGVGGTRARGARATSLGGAEATSLGGAGVPAGAGGTGGAGVATPGGARTRGTGAGGTGAGGTGAGGTGTGGAGAGGAGAGDPGAGGTGAGGTGAGDARAGGAGAGGTVAGGTGAGGASDIPTPRSYAEAITVPSSWANIVEGMRIFRVKRPPGSPPVLKARYVARGFSQRQRVNFFLTFSPTPKMTTLQVLLHVTTQHDYELHSLDFSTAFLQGNMHEEIWLRRPPGFTGTTLAALGFAPSTAGLSLFLRTDTSLPPFYVLVYVDDLVFDTADTNALAVVKSELQKKHTCTDLGESFSLRYSLPLFTPLPTGHSLSAPPSDESVEPSGPYPELVGCLMYLMTCTRPDLAYPLSILARYVATGRHRPEHWEAAKRVLRYLCSTSGMGLVLGGRGPIVLTGHADGSWVDDLATQRSPQCYTFSLGSGSISWRSTRSSFVLCSSFEAEIYIGATAAQELR